MLKDTVVITYRPNQVIPPAAEELRALRARLKLPRWVLADLVHARVSKSGFASSTVAAWEAGRNPMPPSTAELLATKLWLLEHGCATAEELLTRSVPELLEGACMAKPQQ